MKTLIILSLLISCSSALIEWKFGAGKDGSPGAIVNISVGSQNQQFEAYLTMEPFEPGLQLASSISVANGFNPNSSTTFQKTGNVYDYDKKYIGVVGTDNFVISDSNGNAQKVSKKSVSVLNNKDSAKGQVSLTRATDKSVPSFVEQIALESEDPVSVLTYDSVSTDYKIPSTGTLFLGGRPKTCGQWAIVNETIYDIEPFQQWAVEINHLEVGKYKYINPGQAIILTDRTSFGIPETFYDFFMTALNGVGEAIPCDSKLDVVFKVGDANLTLKPEDYIMKNDNGKCYFAGEDRFGSDNFEFPTTLFRDKCILFDYKNKQVGFADKN